MHIRIMTLFVKTTRGNNQKKWEMNCLVQVPGNHTITVWSHTRKSNSSLKTDISKFSVGLRMTKHREERKWFIFLWFFHNYYQLPLIRSHHSSVPVSFKDKTFSACGNHTQLRSLKDEELLNDQGIVFKLPSALICFIHIHCVQEVSAADEQHDSCLDSQLSHPQLHSWVSLA